MTRTEGIHHFPFTDRVIYGQPAAAALASKAARLGASRVLLLASTTLNRQTPVIEAIQACSVALFAKSINADLIVAVGGGSAVDLAKIVIMAMEHDITTEADFDPFALTPTTVASPFPRPPKVRQIAITLNGGEHNAASLVTDTRTHLKQILEITKYTPEDVWMGSGCALFGDGTVLSDAVVLEGIKKLRSGMMRTKEDKEDIEPRREAQLGSWMAAFGLQSRVQMGASHGLGHVLGGTCGVPHYFCTPVMMPSVLRYNFKWTEEAQGKLAEALGSLGGNAADAFKAFVERLGLPTRLKDVGVGEDSFKIIAGIAMNHRFIKSNPRPITSVEDVVELLKLAA